MFFHLKYFQLSNTFMYFKNCNKDVHNFAFLIPFRSMVTWINKQQNEKKEYARRAFQFAL